MNKTTKGAIAGAAGIVLLLGGAGTFALWNDSASVAGGDISSGTLSMTPDGAPVWEDVSADVAGNPSVITPANFLIVPGDTITMTQDVTIDATGDNLLAEFGYTYVEGTLPAGFSTDIDVEVDGVAATNPADVSDGDVVTVVLTLEFDSATSDQVSQDVDVNLADIALTLTQVRPTP
jgi:alternate signal-mediated exported protein